MIRIPQHSTSSGLNDLQSFQEDLEGFQRKIDYWVVKIEECIGHGAVAFEELTAGEAKLSHSAFASLCHCIDQTIDGLFSGVLDGKEIVKLEVVDSSYWEITGSKEFEQIMIEKYGNYDS